VSDLDHILKKLCEHGSDDAGLEF